jgi:NADH:ubiquinone oxidoreductase subunit H
MPLLGLILNNTSHDLIQTLTEFQEVVARMRKDSPQYGLVLAPAGYLLRVAKGLVTVLSRYAVNASYEYPETARATMRHVLHTTPNNLLCFSKIGIILWFADLYGMWFQHYSYKRLRLFCIYALAKIMSVVPTFIAFSPIARLPFWLLGLGVILYEIANGCWVISSLGYGIDWEGESFYKKLGMPDYKRATTNRQITITLLTHGYVAIKLMILCDYFCHFRDRGLFLKEYNPKASPFVDNFSAADVLAYNLRHPKVKVTQAELLPDVHYLHALLEQDSIANLRYGVLFLLALSSLGVYSIILAGWSSNSKYAFIGALRSAAQMISYEVAISLIILPVVVFAGSLNLTMITYIQSITTWFLWPLLPASVLFLIAMLAETNRTPFDLPEAEAELVAGYNVDYSSLPFAMFFLGEYCNMLLMSTLYCILFMGGGLNQLEILPAFILALKASFVWIFFVLVRATLPRYRYDQLMDIGWKVFLPVAGGFLVFDFGILVYYNALPVAAELPAAVELLKAPTDISMDLPE